MDEEDFLAAVEADNVGATAEETKEPEAATEPAPPEPEQAAPEEAAPAPAPVEQPEPEAPKPEPQHAPLAALLDERDKRKALEAELSQIRAQQAQQQQQFQVPDRYEDPDGYEAYQESRIQQALVNQTLNTSERFARKEHGAETVDSAKAWALQRFASDPLYQQQVLSDADPYERVVSDYKRDQLFAKIQDPSEYDAFLAWKAAQAQIQTQTAAPAASPHPAPAIPPRSLASAPSAGGVLTEPVQSDEEIFEETFSRKA